MKINFDFFLMCLIVGVYSSCTNEIEEFPSNNMDENFYPLSNGKYWEYQVDSTIFDNQGSTVLSSSSFVKEAIVGLLEESGDRKSYRVERSWRASANQEWKVTDIWSMGIEGNRAIKTEENLRFIKLIFPAEEGSQWDGNAFIDSSIKLEYAGETVEVFKNWDYSISDRKVKEQIGVSTYDEVVTVTQADDENVIEKRYSVEKYARDVGMVYRRMEIYDSQCIEACVGQSWEDKAQKGFNLTQTLIAHN